MIAGLADYARPAEKLSVSQSSALAATGLPLFLLIISLKVCYYFEWSFIRAVLSNPRPAGNFMWPAIVPHKL